MDGVHILFVLRKNENRGRRLLQAVQHVGQLVLLLDILHLLDHIQVGSTWREQRRGQEVGHEGV